MAIFALIYVLLPLIIAIDGHIDQARAKRPAWFIAVDSAADLIVFLLFAGFWYRVVIQEFHGLAVCLFLISLVWRLGVTARTLRGLSEEDRVVLRKLGVSRACT
jgi:hypothetical protein